MKNKQRRIAILLCFGCMIVAIMLFIKLEPVIAQADTGTYPSVEEYTNDDHLLTVEGSVSLKKITNFADEVKTAPYGTQFDDLDEVIPAQYMHSTEETAVYQYNGAEYGFYVEKNEEYFTVLLIDFVYEFSDENHNW